MNWQPGAHASTFGGNPVAVAAALATIELLEEELDGNATEIGAHILTASATGPAVSLRRRRKRPRTHDRFRTGQDQATKERAPDPRNQLAHLAFERGLLILGCGTNSIRLCPPLVITKDQADFAIDTLEGCLEVL